MSTKGEDEQSQKGSVKSGSKATSKAGSQAGSATQRSQKSEKGDAAPKGRHNKLYRTPPTPPPWDQMEKEKGFTLDSVATSSISNDYSKANPKLGPVVPPFNSQKDPHTGAYFTFHGVDRTLKRVGQTDGGHSIDGPVMDKFQQTGAGFMYLSMRNQFGAGHSRELVDGHGQFMQGIKPVTGFNGDYGFRRNTPWLRQEPSPFGTASRSPTH